jgi:predicted small metal-binding protein
MVLDSKWQILNYLHEHYRIMLTIACREVGQPCDCVLSGESEEELLKRAAEHAVNDHGYKEEEITTPEIQHNIKSHIKRV